MWDEAYRVKTQSTTFVTFFLIEIFAKSNFNYISPSGVIIKGATTQNMRTSPKVEEYSNFTSLILIGLTSSAFTRLFVHL